MLVHQSSPSPSLMVMLVCAQSATLMLEDPEGTSAMCAEACERACNWVMALCLNAPNIVLAAAVRPAPACLPLAQLLQGLLVDIVFGTCVMCFAECRISTYRQARSGFHRRSSGRALSQNCSSLHNRWE